MPNILVVLVTTIDEIFITRLSKASRLCQVCYIVSSDLRRDLAIVYSKPETVLSDQNALRLINAMNFFGRVLLLGPITNDNRHLIQDGKLYFFGENRQVDGFRQLTVISHLSEASFNTCAPHLIEEKEDFFIGNHLVATPIKTPPPRQ